MVTFITASFSILARSYPIFGGCKASIPEKSLFLLTLEQ
nr:MAG TPA: hypothetical protein [Caudoviricetes sp.]